MARTSNLRRQHDAAGLLVGQIKRAISTAEARPSTDFVYDISMSLAKLTGVLRLHFAADDRQLYPSLMASGRNEAAATARQFFDEIGHLGPAFMAFADRWRSATSIQKDWPKFKLDARSIFNALEDRIRRENDILYPLAVSRQIG